MKTKTKKRLYFAALTAALLVSAALVVGCMNPWDGAAANQGSGDEDVSFNIPAGKGIVRLKIANSGARTILPDHTAFPVEDMFFKVEFRCPGAPANDRIIPTGTADYIDYSELGDPIVLPADAYNILITAYDDADQTTAVPIAAWDTITIDPGLVTVSATIATPVTVALEALIGDDDGYFDYSIVTPESIGGFDRIEMEIFEYDGTPYDTIPLLEDEDNADVLIMLSGYYIIKITIEETGYLSREIVSALHIYPAMTSPYSVTIDALIKNVFDVTFSMNGKTDTSTHYPSTITKSVNNGNTLAAAYATIGGPPTAAGWTFDGWYDNATSGNLWISNSGVTSKRVYDDLDLYAQWTASVGVVFTVTFETQDEASISGGSGQLSIEALEQGGSVILSLDGTGWNNYYWVVAGMDLDGFDNDDLVIDEDFCVVLNPNTIDYLEVFVVADDGDKTWSASVKIEVIPN
jgi:uncharacterized repeat protein (TIGR02543 family)